MHDRRELLDLYRRASCVFLDCDGVIFDSNGFKLDAMLAVLAEYPREQREAMRAYWVANGGVARHVKFRHFFGQIAPQSPLEPLVEDAVARFTEYSLAGYRRSEPRPEALALARDAGAKRCVVVSGALESELRTVFVEKGIERCFDEVLGSPATKRELVERVMKERACPPSSALLVGDGAGDFRVCQALGLHFAYLGELSDWTDAERELRGAPRVSQHRSWAELLEVLEIRYTSGQ